MILLRHRSNGPVRQLIGWYQCEASAVIQSIVSLTARRRLQCSTPCEARTKFLVLNYQFAVSCVFDLLLVGLGYVAHVAHLQLWRYKFQIQHFHDSWTANVDTWGKKQPYFYRLQWTGSTQDSCMPQNGQRSKIMVQVLHDQIDSTKFQELNNHIPDQTVWTAGPSQIRTK